MIFFILDRLLKNLALKGFKAKYFDLHYNQGMAFGVDFLNEKILTIIIIIILAILVWGLIKIYKNKDLKNQYFYISGLTFILLGALANLIDRFLYTQVVDYINLGFWPVFNIADAMIVIGAIIIILNELIKGKATKQNNIS